MSAIKECVRIRERKLKNGNISLYLDTYTEGRRQYEFLKLYLIPEKTRADKEANRETMRLANAIKARRVIAVQSGRFGFGQKSKTLFFPYFERAMQGRSGSTMHTWQTCLEHLRDYESNTAIAMQQIDRRWCIGFVRHLESAVLVKGKPLAPNTVWLYVSKLKACFRQAVRDELIQRSPMEGISTPRTDTEREFLTMDELRHLIGSVSLCGSEPMARMFLFSCLTGLRWSDASRLQWADVESTDQGTRIVFRQKKTAKMEYLHINPQAVALMGERARNADERVFNGVPLSKQTTPVLSAWMRRAGISKHITFHCARHTFAVMMLEIGTDVYTVSKLLGHSQISTTQIYAKVQDRAKIEAVARIPDFTSSSDSQ